MRGDVSLVTRWLAFAALLLLGSLLALACTTPCQRHSDCPEPWVCGPVGACELPDPPVFGDPPDAADHRVPPLGDGALDDSDLADPPADAGLEPDAI